MKKNNIIKNIIIYLIIIVLSSGITYEALKIQKQNHINEYKANDNAEIGITNLTENTDFSVPNFEITISEKKLYNINNNTIKNIKLYNIDAITLSDNIKLKLNYTGIKLNDLIQTLNITDYNTIVFKSDGGLQVVYDKSNINDNVFITFSNKSNYKINMTNFNIDLRYSMKNLTRIDFY
jgi:hypothetical protein